MPSLEYILMNQLTWNWPLLITLLGIVPFYLFLVHRYAKRKTVLLQPFCFFTGYLLLLLVIVSPFAIIGHLSYSLHMIQMSILYFLVPPLILLGIPEQLLNHLPRWPRTKWLKKNRFSPNIPLYTFAALFLIYHTPFILTFLYNNPSLNTSYLLLLFALSFGMWHPIASPDPLLRLCSCKMKRYALHSGLAITPACLLFIGAAFLEDTSTPLLMQLTLQICIPSNSSTPSFLPWPFNTKYDQILSGILMMGVHKFSLAMALLLERKTSLRFYEELEEG